MQILQATWEGNDAVSRKLCSEYDKMGLDPAQISKILNRNVAYKKISIVKIKFFKKLKKIYAKIIYDLSRVVEGRAL